MDEKNKEFVAKKNWDKSQYACFIGMIVAMAVLLYITRTIAFMIAFLFVLMALSLYYMWNTFKAEYAYTVSNRLVVEVLKSGNKRKAICEFFLADMTKCGKWTKEKQAELKGVKVFEAATDVKDEDATYYALFSRNGSENVVLFTPNDMMLDEMAKHTRGIIEK